MFDNDSANYEDIWDEATGETVREALARFSTFGPVITAAEARAYLSDPQAVSLHPVMSFGYGDDPVDFTEVTLDDLDPGTTDEEADRFWGPFAIWDEA